MTQRLENPKRVEELNPAQTLQRIGLKQGDSLCDIGAGTGLFTFAAAEQTQGDLYAVDLSEQMLSILADKKQALGAQNVHLAPHISFIPKDSCDYALLCTVLHELDDMGGMLREIRRILRQGGSLAVIEFHKRQTPLGPPEARRISPEQVEAIAKESGFSKKDCVPLGENFYLLLLSK